MTVIAEAATYGMSTGHMSDEADRLGKLQELLADRLEALWSVNRETSYDSKVSLVVVPADLDAGMGFILSDDETK